MDQMKKVRLPGRSTQYIDGEEIYALQIRKLSVRAHTNDSGNSQIHSSESHATTKLAVLCFSHSISTGACERNAAA